MRKSVNPAILALILAMCLWSADRPVQSEAAVLIPDTTAAAVFGQPNLTSGTANNVKDCFGSLCGVEFPKRSC